MQPDRSLRLSRREQERLLHLPSAQVVAHLSSTLSAMPVVSASVCLTSTLCCCPCCCSCI